MDRYLITFRSITFAQRGERTLRRGGIDCTLLRTPKILSERGCSYCLRVSQRNALAAAALLQTADVPFMKLYQLSGDGSIQERHL